MVRLTKEELNVIIKVFSNMVRCPFVAVYHIYEEDLKEINIHSLSDNYIEDKNILKLDGKYYTWAITFIVMPKKYLRRNKSWS